MRADSVRGHLSLGGPELLPGPPTSIRPSSAARLHSHDSNKHHLLPGTDYCRSRVLGLGTTSYLFTGYQCFLQAANFRRSHNYRRETLC